MKFPKITMKMNPIGFFADLMTSKYFLLFIALISAMNIIGYMSMGYMDAVMLFAMVAYLTFVFSKNMTVVLLVAVVVVNLYMHVMIAREGVDSKRGGTTGAPNQAGSEVGNLEALTNKEDTMPGDTDVEIEEQPDVETSEEVTKEDDDTKIQEGITRKTAGFQNLSPEHVDAAPKKKHSHIDYGTTLSDAYKNLEKMLGQGGLKNLTSDTKQLMKQQSELFTSMENIAPLLADAQKMMKKMNIAGANDVKKEGFWGSRVGGIADYAEEFNPI